MTRTANSAMSTCRRTCIRLSPCDGKMPRSSSWLPLGVVGDRPLAKRSSVSFTILSFFSTRRKTRRFRPDTNAPPRDLSWTVVHPRSICEHRRLTTNDGQLKEQGRMFLHLALASCSQAAPRLQMRVAARNSDRTSGPLSSFRFDPVKISDTYPELIPVRTKLRY
jgi:hypothetical protein